MTDFSNDRQAAEAIDLEVRAQLDEAMGGAAKISEFTVDTPLEARSR